MGERGENSFGTKLRQLRQAAGMTQEELAERAGLTAKGIGALERGERRRPYPHTVRALASALGLSVDHLTELVSALPPRASEPPVANGPASSALPVLPSALVGREQDIASVIECLTGENRLLTLTGLGGVGKTSLAVECGHRLQSRFPGGVAFVPLAQLTDPGLFLESVVQALGLRDAAGRSLRDVLVAALQDRQMLVILDNFEQILPAATDVADLLSMCPAIKVLVTSRSPLRIRGEREFVVSPLDIPEPIDAPAVADVSAVPSVQLFVERAGAVSPSFHLTDGNADAVAAICRRLDGLPLAIELAAARTRLLSPVALLQRLDPLLPVLVGGPRDLPERQQTIRASITWSHDLLPDAGRSLFRRLSVFAGGWTLEGAEALAPSSDVLGDLERLVEASLVFRDPADDRYRMLEPIREYASEQLEESGETGWARDRHAACFLTLVRNADAGLKGREQLRWLQLLDAEHDNLRAALGWLLGKGDGQSGALRMAGLLGKYWFLRGHWSEGRSWLSRALTEVPGQSPDDRARALDAIGLIALFQNDYARAAEYLEEGLSLYRQLGDTNGEASALTRLGYIAAFQNDTTFADNIRGEVDALIPGVSDKTVLGNLLVFFGLAAGVRNEIAESIEVHERALAVFREVGDAMGMTWCLTNLGLLKLVLGDLPAATAVLQEDLGLAVRLGEPASIQFGLLGLATIASQQGDYSRAARLWGAAKTIRKAAGMELNALARARTMYDTWVEHARNEAGFERFATDWAMGTSMSKDAAIAYAMSPEEVAVAE